MTGNSLELINGPGGWRGSGFRSYLYLEMDHAFRIPRALIALSDSDSYDQGAAPRWRRRAGNAVANGGIPVLRNAPKLPQRPKHPPHNERSDFLSACGYFAFRDYPF